MAQDTPEKSILEKLAQTQTFHPAGAKLFVPDWTLDPGDVVTVTSKKDVHDPDEEPTEYRVPIYSMDLTWNGTSRLDIQSTGNQEREPLSALRRKEYQTGRRGYGMAKELDDSFKEFETWQTQTDEVIGTYAAQFVDILGDGTNEGRLTLAETAIEQTASDATITAQAAGILLDEDGHPVLDERGKYQYDPNAANTTLTARINTNATNITMEVTRLDGEDSRLSGMIQTESGKISQIVSAVGQNGEVTAGSIILAINKSKDGSATSTTTITADAINLEGYVTASYVDATILTVNQLTSDSGYIGNIKASNINTGGNVVASGAVIGSGLYIGTSAPYTDVSTAVAAIRKQTTGLADGEIGFEYHTFGSNSWTPVNFNIADTAYYKSHVGISSTGEWLWNTEGNAYTRVITANNNERSEIGLPTITVTPTLGTNESGYVNAYGPSDGQTQHALSAAARLYLQISGDYCYITSNSNPPTLSNIVAQKINSGGGGGNYYSTFLDKITLSNEDIGDSVQKYSVANYSDGHRDSEAKTRVVIDASAVYSAGVTAGLGGVVNVEKQPWDGNTCEFKPSAGEGTSASVTITAEPTKVSLASATSTGEIVLKDGDNQFATKNLYLRPRTLNGQNYVVLTDTSSIVSLGNVLAKYSASGGGGTGETRSVYSISDIVLNPADIGPSVTKYPTLYYDDGTDDNTIPIYIDASAVYRRGQQDGAGISILDTYTTKIDSNNTTVTLLPSEKGDYNVMASARVTVEVPVHEGVQGATLLASTDSDTAWGGWQLKDYTQLGKKYGFIKITGKDQSTYSYGIDATDLWDRGVAEGAKAAGYQLTTVKVAESPVKYRAINVPTGTATVKGVTDVTAALYVRDNNGSVHLRGSAVSRYENKSMTLYYMDQSGTARPAGTGSWFFVSDKNVTELYRSGLGLSIVNNATNTFTVATGSRSAFVEDSTGAYTFYSGRDVSNTYFIRSN